MAFAQPVRPVTLENDFVRLEPLRGDHIPALAALTVGTGLTRWFPQPLESQEDVAHFVAEALDQLNRQSALPFVILDTEGRVAGSTRFGAMAAEHRRVEIGWTFVGAAWQRGPLNTAAKLLLLEHGFERLNCLRIELKTDSRNEKSRAAIARLGALQEGILRRHMICADGHHRDTVYFSIVADEWPAVKARLRARLS